MSNTKLGAFQKNNVKSQLQTLRDEMGAAVFTFPEMRVTVLIVPEFFGSKMVQVAVSVCSDDEQKFRRWTGVSNVLDRYFASETIKIVRPDFPDVSAAAIAEIACNAF